MPDSFDRDALATEVREKMALSELSIRDAAKQIGCSPATLSRMLQGSRSASHPEGETLVKAASWAGRSLFELSRPGSSPLRPNSTIADVELHLRALPDLPKDAADGLIAMVKAVYDTRRLKES